MVALKSVKTAVEFWMEGSREKERGCPDWARLRYTSPSSSEWQQQRREKSLNMAESTIVRIIQSVYNMYL